MMPQPCACLLPRQGINVCRQMRFGDNSMSGILNGMRVVEGSAFVAVPCGDDIGANGREVIRFDRLQGGLDADAGHSHPTDKACFGTV